MSLESAGCSITITSSSGEELGYGFSENNAREAAEEAFRKAVDEYIKSNDFKMLTTTRLCATSTVEFSFLVHAVMPR